MNKKYFFFVLLFILSTVLVAASPAMAAAPDNECQPGADNQIIDSWELLSEEEYATLLFEEFNAPSEDAAKQRAEATYDFCDRNDDGYACVLVQTFPVMAALVVDNHPYGGN